MVTAYSADNVLSRIDDNLLAEVRCKSAYIFDRLTGAPGIKSVSGLGLMVGIETERPAAEVLRSCMDRGVLCLTAKHKLRLLPALNIPQSLLEEAIEVILDVCKE